MSHSRRASRVANCFPKMVHTRSQKSSGWVAAGFALLLGACGSIGVGGGDGGAGAGGAGATAGADAGGCVCPDDGNPCTADVCQAGVCTHPDAVSGTTCT